MMSSHLDRWREQQLDVVLTNPHLCATVGLEKGDRQCRNTIFTCAALNVLPCIPCAFEFIWTTVRWRNKVSPKLTKEERVLHSFKLSRATKPYV